MTALRKAGLTTWEQLDARRHSVDDGVADFLLRHYENDIRDVVGYVALGGKRLRGILAVLICEALGGKTSDALPAAVAVELAHAASLVHDDIIDADVVRRGVPALHVHYDLATAILVPHLIVPQAILHAGIYGPLAIRAILQGWTRVTRGQVKDSVPLDSNNNCADRHTSPNDRMREVESEYLGIARDKTGTLFETAAELGAMAARNFRNATAAREYGVRLGIAFQIADDVTDLERDAGQPFSTLLGTHSARSLNALWRTVGLPDEVTITRGAINRARRLAAGHVALCRECVPMFPASPVRELLSAFPAVAVAQIYREASDGKRSSCRPVSDSHSGGM